MTLKGMVQSRFYRQRLGAVVRLSSHGIGPHSLSIARSTLGDRRDKLGHRNFGLC